VGRAPYTRARCGADVGQHGNRGHQRTAAEAEKTTGAGAEKENADKPKQRESPDSKNVITPITKEASP
jgi:hypothetical protein